MGIPTLALNSMRVSCLIFSLLLPLVITKMFLVETHDVASTTNANGMDQDGIGSNEEVERPLKVGGQDYSNGECLWNCVEVCDWKKTKGCKTCKKCVERGKCKSCKKYCSSCKWKKKKEKKNKKKKKKKKNKNKNNNPMAKYANSGGHIFAKDMLSLMQMEEEEGEEVEQEQEQEEQEEQEQEQEQ